MTAKPSVKILEVDGVPVDQDGSRRGGTAFTQPTEPHRINPEQETFLKSGIDLVVPVPLPSSPSDLIGLRALSRHEQLMARAQAKVDAVGIYSGDGKANPDTEAELFRDEVVARSFYHWPVKGDPQPLWESTEDMRRAMSVGDMEALMAMVTNHESWCVPLMRAEMDGNEEVFKALLADIKKKQLTDPARFLSPAILPAFVNFLVRQLSV